MTKRTQWITMASLLGGVALGAAWLVQRDADPAIAADQVAPLLVSTRPLQLESGYSITQEYTGVVRSPQDSQLGFERGGMISEVLVDEGETVVAGQPVARLDQRKLLAQQREVLARLDVQKATLRELEAGPRQQTIAAAKARVEQFAADLTLADLQLQRAKQLRARDSISNEEFDQAQFKFQSIKAQLQAEQMLFDELQTGTRQEQVDAQQAAVDQLQAQADEIELQLEDATLKAPFQGQVTQRHVHRGSIVEAGTPIVKMVQVDDLEVWIGVPPQALDQLKLGDAYSIQIGGQTYTAKLESILAELDRATRTRTLVFKIDHAASSTPTSSTPAIADLARLKLQVSVDSQGCWVPIQALTRGPRGLWSLYVAEPVPTTAASYQVRRIEVESLHPTSEQVFVRGPLNGGEQLIVSGLHRVVPGQACRISDDS